MRFIRNILNRIRTESVDCLSLFLLPVIMVVLPWSWSWRLARWLCRHTPLFSAPAARGLANCQRLTPVTDETGWLTDYRCNILLDHVDIWLSMLAPWKLRRQIKRQGDFPDSGAFVVIGTHWNTGFAVLHQLRACGHQVIYILRKRTREEFRGQWLRYLYVTLRRRHLEKLFPGRRYTPGAYPRKVIKAFQQGKSVLVLADVPAGGGEASQQIELYGRPVRLSSGLSEVVVKMQVNAVFFRVVIQPDTGHRILELEPKGVYQDTPALYADLQTWLQRNLHEGAAGWSMWPAAGQFFAELRRGGGC